MLSNLVTNAIKFTETGGVLVEAEVPAAGVLRFSVTDTGIGIAEDKLASVFEPFTQAEQSTTRRFGGTGIGLTICRRLTSALGGTLTASSTLGQGSTFTFEIPFKTSGALVSRHTPTVTDPHDAPAKPETAGEFAGLRVLAADDSQINREVLFEALRRLGADVTFVEDGTDAVSAAATGVFDLVFMDGSMPGLDGFDATRQIRAWEAATCCRPLPIIGLSAHVIGEHAHAWTACGMSDFITKPFTLATIRDCLQRWTASSTAGNVAPVREDAGDRIVTAAAPAASLRIVDDSVLQSIRDMQAPGDDLVGRVVTLYLTHAPELLEQMMDCALRPDHPADLAAAAHALKSLSRNVGAIRVGDLCSIIEANARDGATPFAVDFAALQAALLATVAAFQTIAGGAGAPAAIVRTGEGFRA